jgi:hypothetical protein
MVSANPPFQKQAGEGRVMRVSVVKWRTSEQDVKPAIAATATLLTKDFAERIAN